MRRDVPAVPRDVMQLAAFRRLLRGLDLPSFAALLREIGAEAYNREILRWRVLVDVSDEIIDSATLAARQRMTDRWLVKEGAKRRELGDSPSRALPGGQRALPAKRGRR